ncbi:MAG: aldehyde dehydrogenase family protein, partial [Emergencia sp.]
VLPVLEFSNLKEVKAAVNSRPRPLALYLFTKSKEAERYVIRNIPFGGGCINDTIMHLVSSDLPFGGIGESGMGSYHGKYSFRTFSHEKSILKKCTLIDMPLRYPPFKEKNMKWLRLFLR